MNSCVPPLVTSRLLLRQLSIEDMDELLPISFYDGKPIKTAEGIQEKLKRIEADIYASNSIHWGIAMQSAGNIIGTAGFYRGFKDKTGEIGYVLNKNFRGQGYMQEAIKAVMHFGFSQLGLNSIIAYTESDNVASIRVLQQTGFTETSTDMVPYRKWVFIQ